MKKIEKTDNFLDSALIFTSHAEEKVKQNNALEIYENYFDEDDPETQTDYFSAKTAVSFPDPSRQKCNTRRPVSYLLSFDVACATSVKFILLNVAHICVRYKSRWKAGFKMYSAGPGRWNVQKFIKESRSYLVTLTRSSGQDDTLRVTTLKTMQLTKETQWELRLVKLICSFNQVST